MAGGNTRTLTVNVVGNATGAKKAMTETGATAEATGSKMSSAFKGAFAALGSASGGAFAPVQEMFDKLGPAIDSFKEKGRTVGSVMVGAGVGIAGAGAALTAFGDKDKAATQQLGAAISATGGDIDDFSERIEKAVKTNEKYGTTASGTTGAIRILTTSTGDAGKGLDLMGLAANLAAAKHISLEAAATMVAKVHGGATKTLKEFGVTLSANKDKTAAATENLDALSKKLSGQASAGANTFTGHMKALKTEVEDQVATIGQKYGPALMGAGAGMSLLGTAATGAKAVMGMFKTTEELGAVATDALAASEGLEATATAGETLADTTLIPVETAALSPVLLIIAAVALLAVGIYELVTHWKTVWTAIQEAVKAAVDFVKGLITGVVGWVKGHWQLLLAILTGPIGLAVLAIKDHFNQILSFITGLPGRIAGIASGMWHGITDAFRSALNMLIDLWDRLGFTLPAINWGPMHIGGGHISLPKIPHLEAGGIALSPMLAEIGHGANGEAVVPLPPGGLGGGGGAITVNVPLYIDGRQFAKATAQFTRAELLQGTGRSTGRVGLG